MLDIESYDNEIVLPKIKQQKDIKMEREYKKYDVLVKIYSPKLTEEMRIKKDIEIKQKLVEIVNKKIS